MPSHTPSKVHDAAPAAVLVVRLEESDARCVVAEIDAVAGGLSACYNALPNDSKAAAIGLSVSLGKLRRRLLGDE